ncbi:tRNA (adenosine(37)-N6)-threonylcarbamoyltransferase complex ATPase subunit type 1 TsaE [Massilibacterium senegalense]|uniref:tRNA (adenosine(37)-N6)-threonylcarbamoyltransferase complex ATPase subunit type 1 TsaE n=1 Tax=Massilibacterium senegalense TaxID=1632858 RepID=UPI0007832F05|nr:tRNA (adenosine(37)-N6)-threonylcarbamoyltransferase complex ATPase subunit type 1 TsaE [Massilibacterium senegalense]
MEEIHIQTNSTEETMEIAKRIGEVIPPGTVLVLEGDLGAGKTTFTKGLAVGLGIKRVVNSPTFTIIKEYLGRLPLYHMDVYRLENREEELGFEEYFESDGITVVEWASNIKEQLPSSYIACTIHRIDEDTREIVVQSVGGENIDWIKEIIRNDNSISNGHV